MEDNALSRPREEALGGNEDTRLLKLIAVAAMLIDHIGVVIFPQEQFFRIIGRMALPLFAWGLVVGCCKTRSMEKYALRVLLLGAASQPLYMMALNHSWSELNIMFTLTLGIIGIYGMRKKWYLSQIWLPALCLLLTRFIKVDYGWKGLLFIYVLYGARQNKGGLIAAYLAYGLFWGTSGSAQITKIFGWQLPWVNVNWISDILSPFFRLQGMIWLSLPLIACKTNSGVTLPKWVGYALYPAHLILLMGIRLLAGTATISSMLGYLKF